MWNRTQGRPGLIASSIALSLSGGPSQSANDSGRPHYKSTSAL